VSTVNLEQLSRHLGLSKTTVSRALNGFPEVNEETRRRVQEAARRFDYTPNASARRLATGRAGAIGIVYPTAGGPMLDPLFADFFSGVIEGAAEDDTDVLLSSTYTSAEIAYRRLAKAKSIDALVVTGPQVEDVRVRALSHIDLPVVVHGRTTSSIPYAFYDIDNEGAFRSATEMLIRLGHRRIGLINGDLVFTFAVHRSAGWHAALAEHGLAAPPELEASGAMTEEVGWREATRMLRHADPPTALLCSSIFSTIGAARAIRDLGLRVGTDVSLVGHDDGIQAIRPEAQRPAITTTHSSIRAGGVRVAEIVAGILRGGDPASFREIHPVDLIFRDSTHPPRRRT
jgi:LacI family transcriptional regulator